MRSWLVLACAALLGCSGGGGGSGPPTMVSDAGGSGGGGALPTKLAFVTSTELTPEFGSAEEADARCGVRAAEAGLSGSFRAWLSDSQSSPSTRFTKPEGNYVSVGGTVIAAGWAGLSSGSLKTTLDYDENNEQTTIGLTTWTGTAADGTATGEDCNDWSGSGKATIGDLTAFGYKWSALPTPGDCTGFRHLYCFEQ